MHFYCYAALEFATILSTEQKSLHYIIRSQTARTFYTKLELQLSPMSMRWNADLSRGLNFKKQIRLRNTWSLLWKGQGNLVKVYARVFKLSLQSIPILTNFSHVPFSVPRSSLYFPIPQSTPTHTHRDLLVAPSLLPKYVLMPLY